MACTGCTPQQAWSEWDLPSITTQLRYWRRHPPVHQLVAAYLDYKPPAGSGPASTTANNAANTISAEALIAMAPPMPDHLKPRLPHGRQ